MAQPSSFIRIQNEPAARLNGADLATDDPTVNRSLQAIRPEILDQLERLDGADEMAKTLPHRERYLRLHHRLSRRILQAYLDWLKEVERELGGVRLSLAQLDGARLAAGLSAPRPVGDKLRAPGG